MPCDNLISLSTQEEEELEYSRRFESSGKFFDSQEKKQRFFAVMRVSGSSPEEESYPATAALENSLSNSLDEWDSCSPELLEYFVAASSKPITTCSSKFSFGDFVAFSHHRHLGYPKQHSAILSSVHELHEVTRVLSQMTT